MVGVTTSVTLHDVDLGDTATHGSQLFELLGTLRPGLTRLESDRLLAEGSRQGLRCLVALAPGDQLAGLALYRILSTSRGRIVFLDDLVTKPDVRSQGVGAALLDAVGARGRQAGCARIELDSGTANEGAHRFYERHGLSAIALHFGKNLG
jgi:GNAT superfamily N-acetyltransferase